MKNSKSLGEFVQNAAELFEAAELVYGHGTSTPFDEAAFIALETLGLPVDGLEEYWEMALYEAQQSKLEAIARRRIDTRKPASYLLNKAYIQGIPFYVDERVIVPRSFIGEIICHEDGFSRLENMNIKSVLDLCTGSGCLAILAAHMFPDAKIDAVDLSPDALEVAKKNVSESEHKDRISLYEGDLFAPLAGKRYDLILTNPPYVDAVAMQNLPPEYRAEPAIALGSGADGLDITRQILSKAADFLEINGGLLCEVGQGKDILERDYNLPFLWLDTEMSAGEVFWLTRAQLQGK